MSVIRLSRSLLMKQPSLIQNAFHLGNVNFKKAVILVANHATFKSFFLIIKSLQFYVTGFSFNPLNFVMFNPKLSKTANRIFLKIFYQSSGDDNSKRRNLVLSLMSFSISFVIKLNLLLTRSNCIKFSFQFSLKKYRIDCINRPR